MNAIRNELLSRMIRLYGFEHPATIEFCELCEDPNYSDEMLLVTVTCHELWPWPAD